MHEKVQVKLKMEYFPYNRIRIVIKSENKRLFSMCSIDYCTNDWIYRYEKKKNNYEQFKNGKVQSIFYK